MRFAGGLFDLPVKRHGLAWWQNDVLRRGFASFCLRFSCNEKAAAFEVTAASCQIVSEVFAGGEEKLLRFCLSVVGDLGEQFQ